MKVAIVLALVAVASAQVAFPGGVIPGGVRVLYPGNFGGYYPFANNQFLVASPFDYGTRIPPVRRVVKVVRPQTVPFVAAPVPVAAPIAVAPKVEEPVDPNPQYDYSYSVNAPEYGDFKTASESRANGVVTGSYSLVEPDGHVRTVEYVADPVNGFNAVVKNTRDGTA